MIEIVTQDIFDRALASEFGIELILDDHTAARSVRRRFYNERNKLRASGRITYDGLSFLIKNQCHWHGPYNTYDC